MTVIPVIPIYTLNYGVIAYASLDANGYTGDFGGQGTIGAISRYNGVGDYTITFTGTYDGVTTANDVTVLATAAHSGNFNIASASMDQGSASSTTIVVRVITYSTFIFPNTRADAAFSVVVTRGAGAVGIAGFANIEGEGVVPNILSSGGDETTNVYAARNGMGLYTVTFDGNFPGVTSMDDITILVTINDDDGTEMASASVDGGSASSAQIRFQVSAWSTIVFAPQPPHVDTSFSVLILRRGTTPPGIRGFVSVNGDSSYPYVPSVLNFGGSETTGVFVTRPSNGYFTVTFQGNFSGVTSAFDVTVLAAVTDDDADNVASVFLTTATSTSIVVTVCVWSTLVSPNLLDNRDFAIVIPR